MPKFKDPKKLKRYLELAMTETVKVQLVTAQAALGSTRISPRDTGRFRSSWFAAKGNPSDAVAAENTDRPQTNAKDLSYNSKRSYHLTNSLPYAAAIALGINLPPSWGGQNQVKSAPPNWFKDFRDVQMLKIQQQAARYVKKRFQL